MFLQTPNPLVDINIYRQIGMREIAGVEERADRLDVVGSERVGEDRFEVADPFDRGHEAFGVVERGGEGSVVNLAPAIAEHVAVDAVEDESAVVGSISGMHVNKGFK